MSLHPSNWISGTEQHVDWYLFHLGARENLFELLSWCHRRGKKVGVVWHQSDPIERLYEFLPHVDFVMVLGIAVPGRSGQAISEAALAVAQMLSDLRPKYGYEVMFDGSVNQQTIDRIHAKYIVAASAVLNSQRPVQAIYQLKEVQTHGRRAA
jgi:pentose-5-phosphate-3-epimerase